MADGGFVITHEDVTERQRSEAMIAYLAHHDALTSLPNRVRFQERLSEALARVHRGETLAVLCLDLDRFKGSKRHTRPPDRRPSVEGGD